MKTNYEGHENVYRARRASGKPGWQDEESLRRTLSALASKMSGPHAPRSGRVLELGCGAGDLSLWLAAAGYEVHGVDISPTAVEWARQKAADRGLSARFSVGSVLESGELVPGSFDMVLDGYCFHCIVGADRALFLANARRLLKPGGVLHVATMCGPVTSPVLQARFDPDARCMLDGDGNATRYIGLAESIVGEIRDAGLLVRDWSVTPRRDEAREMDELLVWATRG